ncbi:MAG: zinc ribbon domain-containing protein [Acidimicrobiia bacterium]|nr:zinc ribbon domain-containing protein [Acidimicrobiia bacterium]
MGLLGDSARGPNIMVRPTATVPVQAFPPGSVPFGTVAVVPEGWGLLVVDGAGHLTGRFEPGRHDLDPDEHLALAELRRSRARTIPATLVFVADQPVTGLGFTGEIDDLADLASETTIEVRCWGRYDAAVTDAEELVVRHARQVDLSNSQAVDYWMSRQLLRGLRDVMANAARDVDSGSRSAILRDGSAGATTRQALVDATNRRLRRTGIGISEVSELELRVVEARSTYRVLAWPNTRCAGCAEPLPAGARYCPRCGAASAAELCPRCDAALVEGAAYCIGCGAEVHST